MPCRAKPNDSRLFFLFFFSFRYGVNECSNALHRIQHHFYAINKKVRAHRDCIFDKINMFQPLVWRCPCATASTFSGYMSVKYEIKTCGIFTSAAIQCIESSHGIISLSFLIINFCASQIVHIYHVCVYRFRNKLVLESNQFHSAIIHQNRDPVIKILCKMKMGFLQKDMYI